MITLRRLTDLTGLRNLPTIGFDYNKPFVEERKDITYTYIKEEGIYMATVTTVLQQQEGMGWLLAYEYGHSIQVDSEGYPYDDKVAELFKHRVELNKYEYAQHRKDLITYINTMAEGWSNEEFIIFATMGGLE